MDDQSRQDKLERISVDSNLIKALYSQGTITREARDFTLDFLYPHHQWGLWVSRLLLSIGTTLLLSGILYFFAFNWAKISPAAKLSSIEIGLVACLIGSCCYSLQRINGQVLLLAASVLVGIFMAVFGQIYQTGANSSQLFMMWSLLTIGWTLVSNFAAQWIFWLIITNISMALWWQQNLLPLREMEFMIWSYMAILNGLALALREYLVTKQACYWLAARWVRVVMVIAVVGILLFLIVNWIMTGFNSTKSIVFSGLIGLIGHGIAYYFYRYRLKDIWSVATIVLSVCIMVEVAGFRLFFHLFPLQSSVPLLLMAFITLGTFACAILYLRKAAIKLENKHG